MPVQTKSVLPPGFTFMEAIQLAAGWTPPDLVEWIVSDAYLDRGGIYPRQLTLLKIVFLADEQFTEYDHEVIGGWVDNYIRTADENGEGNNGIVPDIYDRIRICKEQGRPWFRENVIVIGRRGSKGHMGALAGSRVLEHYMSLGDPQAHFGVDRDKQMAFQVFAGKKSQAVTNQWGDLNNVILGAPWFSRWIVKPLGESLSVWAPSDIERRADRAMRGIGGVFVPTFIIEAKESTVMAARGPASCLLPSTPVLTSDLRWVPIGDLEIGDRLVSVDEYASMGSQRKMREAVVEDTWRTHKPAMRITFVDGSEVVCSPDHPWLKRDMGKGGSTKWRNAASLKPGNHIKHLVEPWVEDDTWGGGYLAGALDGEGCVSGWGGRQGKSLYFSQKPGAMLDLVLSLMKDRGITPVRSNVGDVEQWSVAGTEAMRLLGMVRPRRLMAKAKGVWEGVAPRGGPTASGRIKADSYKTILHIEHLPEQELVDITTSTSTFIANGFVSHNCAQFYDEMAHVVRGVAKASAEEVYGSATPALDQFGEWGFLWEPSSPWQKTGQFYENYQRALEQEEDGSPTYPELFMAQLTSWDPYVDWEIANQIRMEPGGMRFRQPKRAIQVFDTNMERLEKANPETFRVERRSHWAAVMNAYLRPDRIADIWQPWPTEADELVQQHRGILSKTYRAHGDPSKSGAGFGWAIGHVATFDERGLPHVLFDKLHAWLPEDYEGHEVDYDEIGEDIKADLDAFMPDITTFDQFNSVATIQMLRKHVRDAHYPKRVNVHERTATGPLNWKTYETFKTAVGLGLVHAPYFQLAASELEFLQEVSNKKVDHPTSGPVQTKDVADCMAIVTYELIGDHISAFIGKTLSEWPMGAAAQGGIPLTNQDPEEHQALSRFTRTTASQRARRVPRQPGRGMRPR